MPEGHFLRTQAANVRQRCDAPVFRDATCELLRAVERLGNTTFPSKGRMRHESLQSATSENTKGGCQ